MAWQDNLHLSRWLRFFFLFYAAAAKSLPDTTAWTGSFGAGPEEV